MVVLSGSNHGVKAHYDEKKAKRKSANIKGNKAHCLWRGLNEFYEGRKVLFITRE